MSARSRKPDTESLGIESSSVLASSRLQTGVLPFFTTYFGPRTVLSPYIDQRQGQASSNHRVGLRGRLNLKSHSRQRRPTRLKVERSRYAESMSGERER